MNSPNSEYDLHIELSPCRSAIKAVINGSPIPEPTMNACRKRSSYFTPLEQEVLLQTYEEYGHVFSKKSNTAAASKERKAAWEKIAARVNACNSSGEKRTWIQLKMKYKNLIQKANRKRAEVRKTSGGPLISASQIEAEELTQSQNSPKTEPDDMSEWSSSEMVTSQDTSAYIGGKHIHAYKYTWCLILILFLLLIVTDGFILSAKAEEFEVEEEEALFTAMKSDAERNAESMAGQHQDRDASTSTAQLDTLPVKELYKQHLKKSIEKTVMEIKYLDRKLKKVDLEILLLERQLRE
uniref:Myb-like domain-containing protein n=1 Tax=Nothobranchius kadleci TaxID=1051664 RepID=A0A1A8C9U6_NOTKA